MARAPRLEAPNLVYHVVARGNEQRPIFRDDVDRRSYLKRLAHYREKFKFKLLAFCLMDNHVHLAVETAEAPLSRIMAGLQSSYSQAFNRRHRRVGHLFQGRYKAFIVDRDAYLLALVRYVHENPVAAKVVRQPWLFRWSSDHYYRRGEGPDWLDVEVVLAMFGGQRREAIARYRAFMARDIGQNYEEIRALGQLVKGDELFTQRLLRKVGEPTPTLRWLTEEAVVSEAAKSLGLNLDELKVGGRRQALSRGRALAAYVGKRLGGISLDRMGKYLGRDGSTLVRDVGRLEKELKTSAPLRRLVSEITKSLRPAE